MSRSHRSVRSRWIFGLCLALVQCSEATPTTTTHPSEVPDDRAVGADIVDNELQARPVWATMVGDHRYDDRWPVLSDSALESDRRHLKQALEQLTRRAPTDDVALNVDLAILKNALEQRLFEHEVEQPWATDPLWVTEQVGTGFDALRSRAFASADERARAAIGRLRTLPRLLEQAQQQLDPKRAKAPSTRVAIEQLKGVSVLLSGFPEAFSEASPATRKVLSRSLPAALESVQTFRLDLEQRVLPQATGAWRLGANHYQTKLSLTLGAPVDADALRLSAIIEHGRVRREMAQLAYHLADIMFTPRERAKLVRQGEGNVDEAVTKAVLEALANIHATPDNLRDEAEANLDRLGKFVRQHQLVTLNDDAVLKVIWTPPHERGVAIAGLAAPGPLDQRQDLPSFYLVQPLPAEWSPTQTETFLREYNHLMLEVLSMHEAIPGHFVQLDAAKTAVSTPAADPRIRRIYQNGAFVEGWAVYSEHLMIEHGYDGAPPTTVPSGIPSGVRAVLEQSELRAQAIALHRLKFYLRTVTNAIIDHDIHAGTMTRDKALELMVEHSFQQPAEAEGKWIRAQVTSTQLSTYFYGSQAWQDLRANAEAQAQTSTPDTPLNLAAFHDAILKEGAPPLHYVPALLERSLSQTAPITTP